MTSVELEKRDLHVWERKLFREHSTLINEVLDTLRMKNTVITLTAWCLLLNQLLKDTLSMFLQLLCTPSNIVDLNADHLNEARKQLRQRLKTYDATWTKGDPYLWHTKLYYSDNMRKFFEGQQLNVAVQGSLLLPKISLVEIEPQLQFVKNIVEISTQDSPRRVIVNAEFTLVEAVVALTAMYKGSLQLSEEKWNILLKLLHTQSSGDDLKVDLLNAVRNLLMMQGLETTMYRNSSGAAASDNDSGLEYEAQTKEKKKDKLIFLERDPFESMRYIKSEEDPAVESFISHITPIYLTKKLNQYIKCYFKRSQFTGKKITINFPLRLEDKNKKDTTSLGIPYKINLMQIKSTDKWQSHQPTSESEQCSGQQSQPPPERSSNPSVHPSTHSASAERVDVSVQVLTNSLYIVDPPSFVSTLNTDPAPVLLHSPLPLPDECGCTVIMAASKYSRSLLPIGSRVSCLSRVSSVWSEAGATSGLTVVYGGEEFTAMQSSAPRSHLETWFSLHHNNIQELSAVLGDCPLHRETTYLLTSKKPSESIRSLKEIMVSTSSIISRLASSTSSQEKELVLNNVKSVLLEVLSGLSFLHSQGLVYRQLCRQNILLDMRCGCGDVFLCPHKAKDSYRVYLADLSRVAPEEEGGLSQHEDVTFFGWMLEELMFGLDTAVENQLQVVESGGECPELKGLYNVYLSCVRTSSDKVTTVQKLVQDLGQLDTTIPPSSPTRNDMQTTTSFPRSTGGVVPTPSPTLLTGGGVYSAQQETAHENGKEFNAKMIVGHFSSLPKDAGGPTGGNEVQPVGKPFCIDQNVLVYSSVAFVPVPAHEDSEVSNNKIAAVSDQKMDQKETGRGRSTLEGDEYLALLYEQMKDKMEPSAPEGKIIFSTCAEFTKGRMLPLPSAAAMADTIGKGGNGVVSYVYHMGKEFAVKETCLREEELRTLSKLSGKASRNVLPISAVMEGPPLDRYHGRRACYQLMPRATGDVRQMLDRSGSSTLCHYFFKYKQEPAKSSCVLANTRVVLRQALRGLQHLHSKGIVHRDVKLQNILLDMRCGCGDVFLCPHEGRGSYRVYLADFDSALDVERARGKLEERARKGSVLRFTPYGTQGYRAPETSFFYCSNQVLSPEPLSLATRMVLGSALTPYLNPAQDLWSFGCTVLKLFVGATGPISQKEVASVLLADCLRYSTQSSSRYQHSVHGRLTVDDEEMKKLLKVSSVKKYFPLAVELQDLIRQCLQVDPHLRRSAEQCADLPFFKPIDLATDKKSYPSEARQNTPAVELPYPTPRVAGEETYSHQRDGNNINDVKKGNSR